MMEVWKYDIEIGPAFTREMPVGAEVLAVGIQGPLPVRPYFWALVEPGAEREERAFVVHGTGPVSEVQPDETYLGTFQLPSSGAAVPFVGHLFEIPHA